MTQLTTNFSIEELTFSSTAVRRDIDNTAPASVTNNLKFLAIGLERIRGLLGNRPMHIDSGYRCPVLNTIVKGASSSAHLFGYAADFICPAFGTPYDIAKAIEASPIQFDQLIMEGTWVHVSFDPRMRRQSLTARFAPEGASYSSGIHQT